MKTLITNIIAAFGERVSVIELLFKKLKDFDKTQQLSKQFMLKMFICVSESKFSRVLRNTCGQ